MSRTLSLRAHLLFGVVLWTIGLFISAGIFVTHLMLVHPETSRTVHGPFVNAWPIGTVAVICMIGGLFQVRRGLSAIVQLRRRLGAVHEGRERTIDGTYPSEVQPLVTDLNALLDHREKAVKRALGKAGDLAHGLKTPLAVLSQEAERAGAAGHTEIAAAVAEQVERMRRQIDYHLAHARAAASGATPGARCRVVDAAEGLARTLRRLYAGRGLTIELTVGADHTVRCQREDLDEMLGCLLDNACKWARQHITITAIAEPAAIVILVDDDGPGLEPSKRTLVLQRGVRADESAPGSGFGLAIVRDLAELYGGSIELDSSPAGGLRATLKLPRSEGS